LIAAIVGALLPMTGSGSPAVAASEDLEFSDDFERAAGPVGAGWRALRGNWSIQDGAVVAGGTPERVLARDGLSLGATFQASTSLDLPNPTGPGRSWAGIATNIVDHEDGTQSYYALRVGQSTADGDAAHWQLVRIDRSMGATAASLLASGGVTAPAGHRLRLTVESADRSTALTVRISGAGVPNPVERTVTLRQVDRLTAGRVGLYSQDGSTHLHDFAVRTTTRPAHVSFADDFDRADGDVGNGWQVGRGNWRIVNGVATPSGVSERVLYPRAVQLGSTFTVEGSLTLPSSPPNYRPWAGIALNLTDHGDGTQTSYVLRIGQAVGNGDKALWQLVRMSNSTATLLKGGDLTAPPGSRLRLRVTSRNRGTGVQLSITGPGITPVDDYVGFQLSDLLSGGRAGIYSNQGSVGLDDFSVETTSEPPSPPRQLAPLNCAPTVGDDYELPGANETVAEAVEVDRTWAGHPVGQEILTAGSDQYVAYYDANRVMTIAKRTLPSTTWTYQALDSVLGWDSHNYVTMALDSAGNLHVSGNMHGDPLVYFRTTTPGDISTLTRVDTMVRDSVENSVTYPRFLKDAIGALLFTYRDGSSGSGATYYNRYDPATRTWSPLLSTPLTDGEGLRNAYEEGPVRGPDGDYHMALVWRDTADAGSSSMPSYLRSSDLVHWRDSAGDPITLPATYATADVVDPVPIYGGVVNGNVKVGFDAAGTVVVTYSKYDENLTNQLYAARPDGQGGWTTTRLTHWTGHWNVAGLGSLNFPMAVRRGAVPLPDGRLRVDYVCRGAERSLIVDADSLQPVADVPTPQLPAAITTVQSDFPGIQVRRSLSQAADGRYVLRWESLGANNDLPRPPEGTPPPQPLRVYHLTPAAEG
jgi:BNR repeat-containing family member